MNANVYTYTLGKMTKMILAPVGPLQYFLNSPGLPHIYSLEQAYRLLEQDNKHQVTQLFEDYHTYLKKGLLWADRGWKNVCHYYSINEKQGSVRWPDAAAECQYYFNKAMSLFTKETVKGMFYLGAALHLVQDMCVPHHSNGVVFDGHLEFEKWAANNWYRFPSQFGLYPRFNHPVQWIDHNAKLSASLYPLVSLENGCTNETYTKAAETLIPLSIATTAGFLDFTYQKLAETFPHHSSIGIIPKSV
ncbi:transcriptional antiterminator [Desulfosporosinus acidiphilus SJ4]|uniref:Phospholipase C n=1 Tax=Desulfosporosinus acidiphilus (strain DSM 22704 / JCM 16185 / SJ4) TaxID=646529 RepID=I4D4H5_DESAJ|nr:zinc dependent phospholipase C family protein [Desulfosporosinus acidiphilus]AFM40699.1 transcriptional antiterminator [Desulfosporosinus acidiphilus SJ4]